MDLAGLLSKLISFDTASHKSNLEAVGFLSDYLVQKGFRVELVKNEQGDKANLVAELGPYADGLMLCGHLDTLPAGEGWTKPPFELTRENGKLYGRGTSDMKTFIAQAIKASEEFVETELKNRLQLAFTFEEEIGCHGARTLMKFWEEQSAPKPKFAVIGEPTEFQVCRMHKGYSHMKLVFRGIPGHSSRPDQGVSAITHAARAILEIEKLQEKIEGITHETAPFFMEYPHSSVGVGVIQGGEATNQIPGRCEIALDFRSMPGETTQVVSEQLTQLVRDAVDPAMTAEARDKGLDESLVGVDVIEGSFAEPLLVPEGTQLEKMLLEIAPTKEVGGTFYYTDGGIFHQHGIPSLIFGPGNIAQAHKPDEYITEEQLNAGVPILQKLIQSYCV
jgi:acetylornithine deacetylase